MGRSNDSIVIAVLLAVTALASKGESRYEDLLKGEPPKYTIDASGLQLNNYIAHAIEIRADAFAETGDRRFLDESVRYFRAVDAYPDWRQRQFFQSTSHIMTGIARLLEAGGDALAGEVRREIEKSLYEKGVVPSRTAPFWTRNDDVTLICAPAVAYSVFVLKASHPEAYDELFEKAVEVFLKTYANYTDEGNWSQGPGFAPFANDRLEYFAKLMTRLTGDDRGALKNRGYLASKAFLASMIGITGQFYNYADGLCPAPKDYAASLAAGAKLYGGPQPVAVVRSESSYLGVKGGKANGSQQHMDAGSFIFETRRNGKTVRWIEDPTPERFRHLLRMKLALDDYSDGSSRWSVGNMSVYQHSVCFLDGRPFPTDAFVPLAVRGNEVVADLSALFAGACEKAVRTLKPSADSLEITDAFTRIRGEHTYTFNFTTFRKVACADAGLVFDDGAMTLAASVPGEWKIEDLSRPKNGLLRRRPGLHRVSFSCPLGETVKFTFR